MRTLIHAASFDIVHKKLENPNWVTMLLSCIEKYNQGFFPIWYESIFFQIEGPRIPFSIYEAYCLVCLHSELGNGNIVYAEIHLGEKPSRDLNKSDIINKLQKLWAPFRGEFWGGTQNEDGAIYIDEPIVLSVIKVDGCEKTKEVSGRFPLEIGTTDIFKTMIYLNSGIKRLARWPYNSETIYLLARD